MKKKIKLIVLTLVFGVTLFTQASGSKAEVNGYESSVYSTASGTFRYKGEYYRVKQTYLNQLYNALDSEYDLTQNQANACIDYIYNNVATGIESGYLYKVETKKEEKTTEQTTEKTTEKDDTTEDKNTTEKTDKTTEGEEKETETDNSSETSETKVENNTEATTESISSMPIGENIIDIQETPKKSKEEILKETTMLASEMGVNVSYDTSKKEITITDKSGKTLITNKGAIKNTGFRLNSMVYLYVGIIAALLISVCGAWKLKLFAKDDGDEEYED